MILLFDSIVFRFFWWRFLPLVLTTCCSNSYLSALLLTRKYSADFRFFVLFFRALFFLRNIFKSRDFPGLKQRTLLSAKIDSLDSIDDVARISNDHHDVVEKKKNRLILLSLNPWRWVTHHYLIFFLKILFLFFSNKIFETKTQLLDNYNGNGMIN